MFPADKRFADMEMLYYTKTGKTSDLHEHDGKRKYRKTLSISALQLDYAIRLDNLANPRDEKGSDLPKPANYDDLMN